MLPRTSSIWQRDSHPTASGKPGAVQPFASATAWSFVFMPPLVRPIRRPRSPF